MKVIADKAIPFLRGVLEPFAEVRYLDGSKISSGDLADADALVVRTRTRCGEALLGGSPLKMIATATIGFDHIDLDYCRRRGIEVATAAGCNARGVLQWVAAALVRLAQEQGWRPAERTLGVVGAGHVGSLVSRYAAAWGFRVLCCDPPREEREHLGFLSLETLLREADILTLHTPLDASTRHLADDRFFAAMKPGALLVNSSRGGVVDTRALLDSGRGCVLDVWEHEPDLDRTLLDRALLATPHIAGYSLQGKANATALAVRALARRFGWPLAEWYPDVAPSSPREIGWEELTATIGRYFDIASESARLKAAPEAFERIRDGYDYRREYF